MGLHLPRSPFPLHHHHPELLIQERIDPCFHVVYSKILPYHWYVTAEILTHQASQPFSNLLLSSFVEPVQTVFLGLFQKFDMYRI